MVDSPDPSAGLLPASKHLLVPGSLMGPVVPGATCHTCCERPESPAEAQGDICTGLPS